MSDYRIQPSSERYLRPYGSRCERALVLDGSSATQSGRAVRLIDGHNRLEVLCHWAPATAGNLRLMELRDDPDSPGSLQSALRDTIPFAALGAVRVYEVPDDGSIYRVDADSVTWPAVVPASVTIVVSGADCAAPNGVESWGVELNGTPFAVTPAPVPNSAAGIAAALAAVINADPNYPAVAVADTITVSPIIVVTTASDQSTNPPGTVCTVTNTPQSGGGSPVPVLLTSWRQE